MSSLRLLVTVACAGLALVSCFSLNPFRQPESTRQRTLNEQNNGTTRPAQPDVSRPTPLAEAISELAHLVATTVPSDSRSAIYPPSIDGETTALSAQLATELETETALATRGRSRIITRTQLSVVLDEQNLQVGDLTHPDTQVRVGQMLGATHIVTGSMAGLGRGVYRWTLQIIDLTDGTVLGGTRQEVELDNQVHERAAQAQRDERRGLRGRSRSDESGNGGGTSGWSFTGTGTARPADDDEVDARRWQFSSGRSMVRLLQGVWQVEPSRVPRELQREFRGVLGQMQVSFDRELMTLFLPATYEHMTGQFTVESQDNRGLSLVTAYPHGLVERCYVRFLDENNIDLFPEDGGVLPLTRVE